MNTIILLTVLSMTAVTTKAQTEKESVKATITQFVKAGDAQNADQVADLLHENFRVVMNQLFGSSEVSLMDKDTYVRLIRDKTMGGDRRTIEFASIDVVNQNASVKVLLKGKTMTFESLLQLIKTPDGKWKLINDLPFATKI